MARVIGYHRPTLLENALSELTGGDIPMVLLGGGTEVNTRPGLDPIEVIDLQALGLGAISAENGLVTVGATVTLQDLVDDNRIPEGLRHLARREVPSTLRTLATVGGLVAMADPESELLAGLLVSRAEVTIAAPAGARQVGLAAVLESGPGDGIITEVSLETGGSLVAQRTGRTQRDSPIVAAVARRDDNDEVLVALCGVAATPVVVEDPAAVDPIADFRGSASYRAHLARVLFERVSEVV